LDVDISYLPKFSKVNQVEVSDIYCFISVSIDVVEPYQPITVIGVDRNTNGHIAVCSNLSTGKVLKL
jgi:transposase